MMETNEHGQEFVNVGVMSEYALGKLAPDDLLERIEELTGRCLWASDETLPELRASLDRTNRVAGKRKLVRWEL
jgi:hypothetical protein